MCLPPSLNKGRLSLPQRAILAQLTSSSQHDHFRRSWKLLYDACTSGKRPSNMTLKQFLEEGKLSNPQKQLARRKRGGVFFIL